MRSYGERAGTRFAARIAVCPAKAGRSPFRLSITVTQATLKPNDTHALDALTGGAFSAPTSGERAARVREWLAASPSPEQMQEVFRELSGRDKGAAKLLREKLDEIKRSKGQEVIAAEWAEKARGLLSVPKLNIADAMAWQRDAAKAGAPLSREPLASIKAQLADRVKGIEDLQHRVQVQREAAVLLAQRIEVLSTKSWQDAQAAAQALAKDVPDWQAQAQTLLQDANWASVDARFPPLLEASRTQLQVVWDAFQSALAQAVAAAQDPAAPLPPVPVWADELRSARGVPVESAPKAAKPKVDPEVRAQATQAVRDALSKLEQEIAQGHGKASAGAAASLRNALKEHGKLVDDKLENQAHAALAAAGELEGWQRWRADQLRQELVAKAEALFEKPAPVEGQEPQPPKPQSSEGAARKPRYGGRKMQEQLRALREQWKQTDQGGVPNHALWKRFDDACNEAYKVVETWLDKVKAESAEHKAQRIALIEEVKAWAAANQTAKDGDWKGFNRVLHQFESRWREAGHLSEKAFAEMQALWKETIQAAAAPLEAMQKQSLERRHAMIDEAKALGAAPLLRVDAVKALQQRWQAEAQAIPLDRKHEQKLWDAFRKPIDDAFNRKTEEREKAAAQLSDRDRIVLDASKALEAANASGDAQKIKSAMAALEAALRGQAQAAAAVQAAGPALVAPPAEAPATEGSGVDAAAATDGGAEAAAAAGPADNETAAEAAPPPPPPKPSPKPVVAMRGDDRPGMKKTEPAAPMRGGKFGDRKGGPGAGKFGERRDDRGARDARTDGRFGGGRFGDGDAPQDRGPRLGDVAFRAQREALDHAQMALKKLAAQAHGEALTQLMTAWEQRSGEQVPTVQELGKAVSAAVRNSWVQAVGAAPAGDAGEALLRLEIAAEVPTPADHLSARRMLQLQLLTRRNDPAPVQTWGLDTAKVLGGPYEPGAARRLQNVLKALLR
jgi:ATP-dependent RNA helicase SUPV3L1/SUV3